MAHSKPISVTDTLVTDTRQWLTYIKSLTDTHQVSDWHTSSQWLTYIKSVTDIHQVSDWHRSSQWLTQIKSVTDTDQVCDWHRSSQWLTYIKSVTDIHQVSDWHTSSQWLTHIKSATDTHQVCDWHTSSRACGWVLIEWSLFYRVMTKHRTSRFIWRQYVDLGETRYRFIVTACCCVSSVDCMFEVCLRLHVWLPYTGDCSIGDCWKKHNRNYSNGMLLRK